MKTMLRRFTASLFELQVRRLFKHHSVRMVAVSGSVGKTSTKLAIATVLSQKYRVLVQQGSFNDEIGLPLACFNLPLPDRLLNPFPWLARLMQMEAALHRPYPYDVLVIEVGSDAPGEVPHALTYLHPDIGVVTAVTPEHMEYFHTLDAVAAEELALALGARQALINYDDVDPKYRQAYLTKLLGHFSYGVGKDVTYRFAAAAPALEGTMGSLLKHGQPLVDEVVCHLYGQPGAKIAAAAGAVGDLLGLSAAQIAKGLGAIRPVSGRMNPLPGLNGSLILDDTYNSSPEALAAALATLNQLPVTGRRLALLGSMNELGADAPRYHQELGVAAAAADLDQLITLGADARRYLGPAAIQAGLDSATHKPADSPAAAAEYLRLILQPGDVLLAKGSQNGVFAEEAIKPLLANPADATQLVRQSPQWLRRKAKQFTSA